MSERERHRTDPSNRRELCTEEALDIESDRRRRVVAAFLLGGEARPDRPDRSALRPWRGVAGGIGLTVAAIVVVGVVAVASATLAAGGSVTPSPTAAAVPSVTPPPGVSVAASAGSRRGSEPSPARGRS
jgi:hypothetical protein